ncbi:MAG: 23S rRNA (guanosine(2251)-2'-O)-methyltransferase RlmB, partial [Gammaproteobacteria bacterium]|nr:23S rRNA (guanosine(2251)-2'-O)-methyltransferase RlmB [Gammaproteobacteria bacterium]
MSRSRYVTGLRAVEQLMASKSAEVRRICAEYRTANPRVQALIDKANKLGIEVQAANRARLKQISGEVRHQGIVAELGRSTVLDEAGLRSLVEERLQASDDSQLLLLLLDGVQDPHNLGACMRTADAAGVDAIVVPRHGAAGLGSTVSKVAAGAAEALPFASVGNLGRVLGWLKDYGVTIVGTSDKGNQSLYDTDLDRPVALVMGREHTGLGKRIAGLCDDLVSLPMH